MRSASTSAAWSRPRPSSTTPPARRMWSSRSSLARDARDSAREATAAADAGRAVHLREADRRVARYLTFARVTAQLQHDLVHLAHARRTDRLAVRNEAAVGVDGKAAADLGLAVPDHRLLIAVGTEAGLGHVHDLRTRLAVLELRDVDVRRRDARLLEALRGRVDRRAVTALDGEPRREHLERPELTRPQPDRPEVHRMRGEPRCQVGAAHHDGDRTFVRRAEHVLRERVVEHARLEDLLLAER